MSVAFVTGKIPPSIINNRMGMISNRAVIKRFMKLPGSKSSAERWILPTSAIKKKHKNGKIRKRYVPPSRSGKQRAGDSMNILISGIDRQTVIIVAK
jgi:hypothetical protein